MVFLLPLPSDIMTKLAPTVLSTLVVHRWIIDVCQVTYTFPYLPRPSLLSALLLLSGQCIPPLGEVSQQHSVKVPMLTQSHFVASNPCSLGCLSLTTFHPSTLLASLRLFGLSVPKFTSPFPFLVLSMLSAGFFPPSLAYLGPSLRTLPPYLFSSSFLFIIFLSSIKFFLSQRHDELVC